MSTFDWNRAAWDRAVGEGNPYTRVVSPAEIAAAREGRWALYLSDLKPVPVHWFPPLVGLNVLCLASGGGQQAPILAALGATVTVLDASPRQLDQDRLVAERDHLSLNLVEGDMADLSRFQDESFQVIVNPPSTLFVPDLAPIWAECHRVLTPGGILMTGFMNPDEFMFDPDALDEGRIEVKYRLPFIEHEALNEDERADRLRRHQMFHFSHSMESQLGGLIQAGFVLDGFYEDRRPDEDGNPLRHYMPSTYVVRARKTGAPSPAAV